MRRFSNCASRLPQRGRCARAGCAVSAKVAWAAGERGAARTADGHADRSTALALAIHAAQRNPSAGTGAFAAERVPTGLNARHRPALTRYRCAWTR